MSQHPLIQTSSLELLADCRCDTGELPQWDAGRKQLIWSDITGSTLYRWHQVTGEWEKFYEGRLVGGITLQTDDSLLLFGDRAIFRLRADGSEEVLVDDFDPATGRCNDTIADPEGRVFFGTVGAGNSQTNGGLYRLDHDGFVTKITSGTGCANGMGFSPDASLFYWSDSTHQRVWAFDYHQATGNLEHQRLFLDLKGDIPDGMTVDVEGCLWIAFYLGSCVRRYSPEGELLATLTVPTSRVTSCLFGGDAFRDLFVTTAGGKEDVAPAGGTFRARGVGQGLPEFRSHILLGER